MRNRDRFYTYIIIIQKSRNTLILRVRFCLYLVILGVAPLVDNIATAQRNLRGLVKLDDCLFGGCFRSDPEPLANALVGDPPLDCSPAMPSAGSDRDLRR